MHKQLCIDEDRPCLVCGVKHSTLDNPTYQRDMSDQEIKDWVDHSPDNLWVLCDVHHRHKYLGIHEISYPIWAPQDLLRPDFEDYVKRQVRGDGNDAAKAPDA